MPQDPAFRKFVDALAKYREGVNDKSFPSYEAKVGTAASASAKLVALAVKESSPQKRACFQQALDMMQGARRAIDMRNMTHQDYMQAYGPAQIFQARYEQSRLIRFESGQF